MQTVWVRNPVTCIRECAELRVPNITWSRGFAVKQRIDPQKHLELHYPSMVDYRLMLVGDQGSVELRRGRGMKNPYAVYPTWTYGDQMVPELEAMMALQHLPTGSKPDERGVPGQDHMVVITGLPNMTTPPGKAIIRTLWELKRDYPDCTLHMHNLNAPKTLFSYQWGSVDINPVDSARRGGVILANGRLMHKYEKAAEFPQWLAINDVTVGDLSSPQERTKFNIRSCQWMGRHFEDHLAFRVRGGGDTPDYDAPDDDFVPVQVKKPVTGKVEPNDKIACDHCSLAPTCKYYREGSVCTVPGSAMSELATQFGTRDADTIITGLGELVTENADRFVEGRAAEKGSGELNPEVTKVFKTTFEAGVRLAKLLDPSLNQPGVQVNVGVHNNPVAAQRAAELENTPAQLMAKVVHELTEKGIPLEHITAQMVAEYMVGQQRAAIEAAVVGET